MPEWIVEYIRSRYGEKRAENIFEGFLSSDKGISVRCNISKSTPDEIFMMLEITIQGVFYGIGRTMPPAVISVSCNYLRIPMALLFVSWGWGLPGIWWSVTITSTMKGIICLIWFMAIKKKALSYQAD